MLALLGVMSPGTGRDKTLLFSGEYIRTSDGYGFIYIFLLTATNRAAGAVNRWEIPARKMSL